MFSIARSYSNSGIHIGVRAFPLSPTGQEVPALRAHAEAYWQEMQRVTRALLDLLGASLGLPQGWAEPHIARQGLTQLVAANYPPQVRPHQSPPAENRRKLQNCRFKTQWV